MRIKHFMQRNLYVHKRDMLHQPFTIFKPFSDAIDIRLFTKADALRTDIDLSRQLNTDRFVSLKQIHGNTTVIARSPIRREKEADGVLTDQQDLWLSIRVADCQAFVIYAPEQNVIGLLHAGWNGLVKGAIPAFFEEMKREWDIDPSTVLMGAAPSLCTNCAEFTDPVTELPGIDPRFFHGRHADLRAIADDQLMQCGVAVDHMERLPDCTKCRSDIYWSYREGEEDAVIKGRINILTCALNKRK